MDAKNIKEIISMIKGKNPQGFEMLYNKYFRFMFGITYAVLKNENDCYDVIQNVMLRLYALDEALFPTDHEFKWLQTVVKNEALMYLRREKVSSPLEDAFELPIQDKAIEDFVDMESFYSMTASLNEKQRTVVTMKVLGDMTHKEISNVLSLPIGTVQWIYATSIKKLRHTLTALTGLVLGFGGGFWYQLSQYFGANTEQPGDIGISSIPSVEPSLSPWLIAFSICFLLTAAVWILFFKFSDRIPTDRKS
ncbi:MAG: sigma-70 family RNA polymerase sigma factor [Lachnospiraceae bacterium]|nr:sigma-70 family RNA polymerase sigma factor [Lachnospiraceae bacterium]